jgi:hypothetical protein
MSAADSARKSRYKNTGLGPEELRRRREEEGVQLRKQKREEQLSKKRNIVASDDQIEDESDESTVRTNGVSLLDITQHLSKFLRYSPIFG